MRPTSILTSLVVLIALLLFWVFILRVVWTKTSRTRSILMKSSLLVSTLAFLFLTLEVLFYFGFAVSDTFGFTLASQRWNAKYYRPVNSYGYRDVEHDQKEFATKELVEVVGDSFVAGHGIPHIEDRFSNILQKKLGSEFVVVNIARNGWNTSDELKAVQSYPYKPKKIILSYFINDILGAAERLGHGSPVRVEPPANKVVRYIVDHSYTFNFAYWRLYRFHNTQLGEKYWTYIENAYLDATIWGEHEQELLRFVTYAQKEQINLSVVLFPNLADVKRSAPFTSKVAGFFRAHNVPVLDLEPLVEGRDPKSLTVNSLDSHPNEALNKEVADLLMNQIQTASQ